MSKLITVVRLTGIVVVTSLAVMLAVISLPFSGWKALSVQTGSMRPNINPGALVLVKHVPIESLRVGDAITYVNPTNSKETITHRITQILGNTDGPKSFVVKGDANAVSDVPVSQSKVVGRVQKNIPYIGKALDFVRTPLGLLALIYAPALAAVITEIRRLSAYYKRTQLYQSPQAITRLRKLRSTAGQKMVTVSKMVSIIIVLAFSIYVPVQATLLETATLSSNTITSNGLEPPHIVLSRVTFRCSNDNTNSDNKRPEIVIYNPTNQNINIGGWVLSDNNGNIVTLPSGRILKKNHKMTLTPWLSNGLQYAGDRIVLSNASASPVDAISWGNDISQLNPSITQPEEGTRFKRKNKKVDNNIAQEWKIDDHECRNRDDEDDDHNDCHEHDRAESIGDYRWHDEYSSDDD